MKTTVPENLSAALRASGVYPFQVKSSYHDSDAEQNLRGRTHYVDPDTRKHFAARILDAGMYARGVEQWKVSDSLIYWIVESVNSRPDHGGENKRFVAFDVFGSIINDRASLCDEPETGWHRTTEAAKKEGLAFLKTFNAEKHVRDELKARANRQIKEARETLALLRRKKTVTA